jgi:hypothetical protein
MKRPYFKKRYKIFFGIVIFFAIILFAAPRIGRLYIVKNGQKLIGREISIKKIRLNYFTGTLRIDSLKLFETGKNGVFLSFARLKVNLDYFPLLRNEFVVRYITLNDPYVQVLQNGDSFNFSDLMAADTVPAVKDTIPQTPTKYIINNISINSGYVKYTDAALHHTIALNKLDLLIPGFTWNADSTNLDVNFRFVDGGGFNSSVAINQADSTYSLNLRLDSLNLDIIEPYVQNSMYISALHGYLSNDLLIKGSMQSVMQLFIKGVNHIYGFQMLDTLKRTVLSFNDLTVDIDTILPDKNNVKLNYLGMSDPFILFEMIDSTNNLLSLMKPSSPEQADTLRQEKDTTAVAEAGSFSFSKLLITGGKVQFADKTLRYPFDFLIDNFRIESQPASGKPGKLSLKMAAALNGTGSFSADGIIDPADFNNMDLALSITQFRMKDLDAYFKHYFGFPVEGGIGNFRTDNIIRPSSIVSNNSIYFRKFVLGQSLKTKSEYKVPLRLALGILSDKDGVIDLKVPVESSGTDTKVRNLGKIIFKVIGNLFVKAALSPFNALSGPYNVDPSALQEIRLPFSDPSPDEKNMKSVDIVADILVNKPGLSADLYYCQDRIMAADSLAHLLSINDFILDSKNRGINVRNVADSSLVKYISGKLDATSSPDSTSLTDLCRKFIGDNKLNAGLDSIKALQTGFIATYLNHDKVLSPDRFRIITIPVDTIRSSGNYPSFRVYFTAGQ